MRIDHVAIWTRDLDSLERLRAFHERWFHARSGARYESARRPGFVSRLLEFPADAPHPVRLELMTAPDVGAVAGDESAGYAHLAIAVGSPEAVDALAARMAAEGVPVVSPPRWTGDGFYEAVVRDPDGNLVEITV